MTIRKQLKALMTVIVAEADQNPEFAQKLALVFGWDKTKQRARQPSKRRGSRRTPGVLDPVALYGEGEDQLREKLKALDIEQLKDIVAECGMDPSKLVMKWKSMERIANHIVEVASTRAKKGDAFR